ncbi:MAG TPA: hypothetical protein VFO44_09120 [Steroidobacteraceae bacterium]|nr:hypothetical protein [Steroidobacteraceae bacterium]
MEGVIAVTASNSASPENAEQAYRYREMAKAIRVRLLTLQDEESVSELYLLAAHYERLAEFADSSGSLGSVED